MNATKNIVEQSKNFTFSSLAIFAGIFKNRQYVTKALVGQKKKCFYFLLERTASNMKFEFLVVWNSHVHLNAFFLRVYRKHAS